MRIVVDANVFVSAAFKEASWPGMVVGWVDDFGGLLKTPATEGAVTRRTKFGRVGDSGNGSVNHDENQQGRFSDMVFLCCHESHRVPTHPAGRRVVEDGMSGADLSTRNSIGFYGFLHAFTARWFYVMSGGLGVPLTIVALFVGSTVARVGLAVTAVAGFIFAAYGVWRSGQEKIVALQIEVISLRHQSDKRTHSRMLLDGLGMLLDRGNQLTIMCADYREPKHRRLNTTNGQRRLLRLSLQISA
jgi:hypothetical protein